MLNVLWPLFIVISFAYGIVTGKANEINKSIFDSTADAVNLCITLMRKYVFVEWYCKNYRTNKYYEKNHKIAKSNYKLFI